MNVEDARAAYYEASATLSELCRQLCFAGVAVVWFFRKAETAATAKIEDDLLWPLAYLVLSLALDLGQYIAKTLTWGVYARYAEHKLNRGKMKSRELTPSAAINGVPLILFWGKLWACGTGYAMILALFYGRFFS